LATAIASTKAQSITLGWDPETGVSGFKLYQGGASRVYTNSVDNGTATQRTISSLTPGRTYYFAVTAYSSTGLESANSSEISYTVPITPVITLTSPTDSSTYSSPATVHLAANVTPNGHTITKVQFLSSGSLINEVLLSPFATDLANVKAGSYSYSARLVYDTGLTLDTPAVGVTVASSRPVHYPRKFTADSGALTAPFVSSNGVVSQPMLTSLAAAGEGVYNFTIDVPGNYIVSATVSAPSDAENSLYVNVDAEPTDPYMIWDVPVTSGFTNVTATWRGNGISTPQFSPKYFNLTAGNHLLYLRGREANTEVQSFSIAPATSLLQATVFPGQTVSLSCVGQPAHQYEVQASRDFKNWSVLGTVTADSNGNLSFTDTGAPSYFTRFYRLRDTSP
jgi:hypothetical protein